MPKKVSDVLTQDELNLLQEVIDSQDVDEHHDVFISHISKQMLSQLTESDDIVLVTSNQQDEFRFPLYMVSDGFHGELKELGPPDIIDHNGSEGRYWRLADPEGLKIFDPQGEKSLGAVMNISTSGLFMLCSPQQFALMNLNVQEQDNLSFYLKIPNRGFHLVNATVVRIERDSQNYQGLALNFDINNELALILHDYIMEKHSAN
ncbi:MAG: hypothetical protein ACI935_001155 [Moritella dasanensis]|jgi:hypothetical protein